MRIRLAKQCLYSWKVYTMKRINRRRECFLMMIFNRWRLWAEENIEDRRKHQDALMHWATAYLAKSFRGLREIVQQSKENRRSYSYTNRLLSPSVKARTSLRDPFSISYRSPERSMILNRIPDPVHRFSLTQSQSGRRHSYFEYPVHPDRRYSSSSFSSIRSRLSSCFNEINEPCASFAATRYHQHQTSSIGSSFNGGFYPMDAVSLHTHREEVRSVLDEMVAKVEQRHQMHWCYQPANRYAGYAGCAPSYDQLYHRL